MPPHEPSASWRATIHALGPAQGARRAGARDRAALVAVQHAGRGARSARPASVGRARPASGAATGAQLVDAERQRAHRAVGGDDGERHDRLAGPAGEVVDVEREPAAAAGSPRAAVAGRSSHDHSAEQRQPDAGEDPRRARCRRCVEDERGGAAHVRGVRRRRRRGAARRRPRRSSTGRRARRGTSPTCRRRAAASGSSAPAAGACSRIERRRGTGAAAGPRRPSSRWSRARPSTSPSGCCIAEQRVDATVERRRRRSAAVRPAAGVIGPAPTTKRASARSSAATAGAGVGCASRAGERGVERRSWRCRSVTARPPHSLDELGRPRGGVRRTSRLGVEQRRAARRRPSARSSAATTGSVFLPLAQVAAAPACRSPPARPRCRARRRRPGTRARAATPKSLERADRRGRRVGEDARRARRRTPSSAPVLACAIATHSPSVTSARRLEGEVVGLAGDHRAPSPSASARGGARRAGVPGSSSSTCTASVAERVADDDGRRRRRTPPTPSAGGGARGRRPSCRRGSARSCGPARSATAPGTPTASSAPTAAADSSGERRPHVLAAVARRPGVPSTSIQPRWYSTGAAQARRQARRPPRAGPGEDRVRARDPSGGRGGVAVRPRSLVDRARTVARARAAARRGVAAAHGALHRGRPAGVGPRAGEARGPAIAVRRRRRGAPALPGTPRNVAARSAGDHGRRRRWARRAAGSSAASAADHRGDELARPTVASSLVGRRQRDGEVLARAAEPGGARCGRTRTAPASRRRRRRAGRSPGGRTRGGR